ncbi:MAG: hypothetical protein F2799_07635 [Actinobacteria bacterium]|uniref:Unannotated protein n=1 Tax=freshwater metagenome TaxID=449393 RepID=A0A6J7EF48_9ZZZZ|nr:hypothetical protein [Actinomycetota bacterium]
MGLFFIDTSTGHVATFGQLREAGIDEPEMPWMKINASIDATTLWHTVLVKEERGIFIGTLTLRHGDHHSLLLDQGWQEIAPEMVGSSLPGHDPTTAVSPSPWTA